MAGEALGAVEVVIDAFQAGGIAQDGWLMAEAELRADFGGAFVVPEENDFDAGMEESPALESIALNDGGMAEEGLGGGEKRKHRAGRLYIYHSVFSVNRLFIDKYRRAE